MTNDIRPDDVLLGRGGATNNNEGNKRYRAIVHEHQPEYLEARKKEKALIARRIVRIVRERGGRFLKRDEMSCLWTDVGDKAAGQKTSQALREGLDVRKHIGPVTQTHRRTGSDSSSESRPVKKPKLAKDESPALEETRLERDETSATCALVSPSLASVAEPQLLPEGDTFTLFPEFIQNVLSITPDDCDNVVGV